EAALVTGRRRQRSSSVRSLLIRIFPEVNPQSTGRATPVIAEAASDARKATALAISTGSTTRPRGYQRRSVSRTLGSFAARFSQSGVRTVPGSTIFARTPSGPYSCANERVSEIIDALAA